MHTLASKPTTSTALSTLVRCGTARGPPTCKKGHAKRTPQAELENTLGRLPRAEDAPFNSFAKQHEPACLPDTRVALLDDIHSWADGTDERCIFWLSGLAGTGKSTIARTVARRYHDRRQLAASFFFSRGGGDVGHVGKFVTSIAVQLAHSVPAVRQHISNAVAERSDVVSQSLRDQWQQLVVRHSCRCARRVR
jgi:hypothetical protein